MVITVASLSAFMDIIALLVQKGLTFKADGETLVITLTGGF